jgi:hypothetical protein
MKTLRCDANGDGKITKTEERIFSESFSGR